MGKSTLFSVMTLALVLLLCDARNASPYDQGVYVKNAVRSDSRVQVMKMGGQTMGYVKNCGNVPFNISWTPAELHPYGSVTIKVTYEAPHDMTSGFVNASLSFHGDPDPFIGYDDSFKCDQVSKYIKCPMHKSAKINEVFTIKQLHALSAYPGDYDAKVVVKNQDGKLMICAEAHIIIKNY